MASAPIDLPLPGSARRSRSASPPAAVERGSTPPPPHGVAPALWQAHLELQHSPGPEVLERLVDEYSGMAIGLAKRWHRHGEPLEDLEQVALEALVKALLRFDCSRRLPFPALASPTIVGALKRHYRDQGWALRVPRVVHELASPVRTATESCRARTGLTPTRREVAEELGVPEATVGLVQSALHARSCVSFDAPAPDADPASSWEPPAGTDEAEATTDVLALADAVRSLDERSRDVLGLYYFQDLSQTEIAERYGVSQMQVSRWLASTLRRLRTRTGTQQSAAHPVAS